MRRRLHRPALVIAAVLGLSCARREPTPGPPPLPSLPAEPAPPPAAVAPAAKAREDVQSPRPTRAAKARSASEPKHAEKSSREAPAEPRTRAPGSASPSPHPGPAPGTAPPSAGPASPSPRQTRRVVVPSTDHLRAEIPSGLAADLDADPRMQAWLDRAIALIDDCHAQAGHPKGAVQATLTMHEEARPSADLGTLPPALGGVVACATGALLRIKMPLFTGREGTRYTVRMHFE